MLDGWSGFGQLATEIFDGLSRAGLDVWVRPIKVDETCAGVSCPVPQEMKDKIVREPRGDLELVIAPVQWLPQAPLQTIPTACFTMWETTLLPHKTVRFLNACHHVFTPSAWGQKVMIGSGVGRPLSVIPLGVHPDIFVELPMVKSRCVFGAAGTGQRKRLDIICSAFTNAFPTKEFPDVELRLKTLPNEVLKLTDKRIKQQPAFLKSCDLARWYSGLNVFVNAGLEGWGCMPLQSMCCGRPVMSITQGGISEFFDWTVGFPVASRYSFAGADMDCTGKIATAEQGSIECQMRRAYMDMDFVAVLGKLAAKRARKYTWENTIERLIEVLK